MKDDFYKQLIETLPTAYAYHRIICDDNGIPSDYEFLEANPAFEEFTGLKVSEIVGRRVTSALPDIMNSEFNWIKIYGQIAINGGEQEFTQFFEPLKKWYRVNAYSPEKYYFVTYFQDITKEMTNVERLANILEGTNVGTWEWNVQTGETGFNERWAGMIGYTLEEISPVSIQTWLTFAHPEDITESEIQLNRIFAKQSDYYDVECRMKHKDGSWIWVHDRGKVMSWTSEGKPLLMSGTHTDISERKRLELDLAQERNLLKTTLISVGDGVISTDNKGNIVFLNKVAESLTGWSLQEAKGKTFQEVFNIVNEFTQEKSENIVNKVLESGKILELANHTLLISKDGIKRPIEDSAAPIIQETGEIIGVVVVFRDFSEKKAKQEEILYLSYHDQLTGLYNRRFYEEELKRLDTKRNFPITVVMADVNGLKLINDSFGHTLGDNLLKKAADVIRKGCRVDDIIARIGGDEFVILLPNTDVVEAELIIQRIKDLALKEKVGAFNISMSFGYETKKSREETIHDILKKAEDYMYRNKLYESSSMRNKTIDLIMTTLYEKSDREMSHSKRVSEICNAIASNMEFNQESINQIRIAGLMHDIGKMGIDEKILNKCNGLNNDEWKEIKRHPEIGYRILSSVNEFSDMASYILEHHERWDGNGYPRSLKGEEISLQARIIAIADAFDAMTSVRTYSNPLSKEEAISEVLRCSGTQFDPYIAKVFVEKVLKDS